jgi:hypothetical protein
MLSSAQANRHVAADIRPLGVGEFNILQHVGQLRKVGRNYVARCPSCAVAGRDRSSDNLAVLIKDSRFYKCWAGCTKEMIREALGCNSHRAIGVERSNP